MPDFNTVTPAKAQEADKITQEVNNLLKATETAPEYPNVFPINLAGGRIYIDSTPNKENVYIRHKSGSFIYFEPNGDVFVHSPRDLKVSAERNLAMKVGEGSNDKCVIHVTGDTHLKVDGDYVVEVGGNKSETISGNYNLNVKGTMSTAANTRNTKTTGTHTELAYEKLNVHTFLKNNIGLPDENGIPGGEVRDIIFGNRLIEMGLPNGTFVIRSAGSLELTSALDMRVETGLAFIGATGTAYTQTVGGAALFNAGASFNLLVGCLCNIKCGGILDVKAPQIWLN